MDLTKFTQPTVEAIKQHWQRTGSQQGKRHYLGGSIIGHHCERKLWYDFRHMAEESFDGRMYRLFNRGHREEATFVEELRAIGVEVHEVGADGKQFALKAVGGHVAGHMDGAALGLPEAPKTWHVLEFKTHSAKSFKDLQKKGVRDAKFQHYAQMMLYMKWAKLTRAFYLAVNKDNDELYSERIKYNAKEADALEAKARRIVESQHAPERPYSKRDYYLCNWCSAQDLCWGSEEQAAPAIPVPSLSCRQCLHATPEMDGDARWSCAKKKTDRNFKEQATPCRDMLLIPSLVEWAKPVDAMVDDTGADVILFENEDGSQWLHGPNPERNQYSAHELTTMPQCLVGSTGMNAMKTIAGGAVTRVIPDIAQRYSEATRQWSGALHELPAALAEHGLDASNPDLKVECEDWKAAEWGDVAAFIYPNNFCAILAQKI